MKSLKVNFLLLTLTLVLVSCGDKKKNEQPAQANNTCVPNQFGVMPPQCMTNGFVNGFQGNGVISMAQLQANVATAWAQQNQWGGGGWGATVSNGEYNGNANSWNLGSILTFNFSSGGWQTVGTSFNQRHSGPADINAILNAHNFIPYDQNGTIGNVSTQVMQSGPTSMVIHSATETPGNYYHETRIIVNLQNGNIHTVPQEKYTLVYQQNVGNLAPLRGTAQLRN